MRRGAVVGTGFVSCRPSGRRSRYRSPTATVRPRRFREQVLAETDLFLPATERAALALRLEGVPSERMVVCPPGIDTARFAAPSPQHPPTGHTIVSPGRLVWEKGHQDVLRALALLHRGIVRTPAGETVRPRLLIVGAGPEKRACAPTPLTSA